MPMVFSFWILWGGKVNTTPHKAPALTLQVAGTTNVGAMAWTFPWVFCRPDWTCFRSLVSSLPSHFAGSVAVLPVESAAFSTQLLWTIFL